MGMSICKERLALCKGNIQKYFNAIQDFFALFRLMVDRLPQFDVECWAVMSWAIWNARNKFYFEKFQAHLRSILNGAFGFLDEYQSSEACGCTPKLLILFVTFVCSGLTCTMFPPFFFLAVSSYCYSHCLSPIWFYAQSFYFVYFQLSI